MDLAESFPVYLRGVIVSKQMHVHFQLNFPSGPEYTWADKIHSTENSNRTLAKSQHCSYSTRKFS